MGSLSGVTLKQQIKKYSSPIIRNTDLALRTGPADPQNQKDRSYWSCPHN